MIPTEGLFDTIVNWDLRGRYASGIEFTLRHGGDKTTFVGTDGWVAASRGGIEASAGSLLKVRLSTAIFIYCKTTTITATSLTVC